MKFIKKFIVFTLVCIILGVGTVFGLYLYVKPELPDVATLHEIKLQTPMQIYSQDEKLIAQYGEKRRIPVNLDEIPHQLIQAIIATEDSRFYEHPGIDPIGIARAIFTAASSGHLRQGASTITQQLARNFFLTRERKLMRKVKEAFIAIHIESLLTKDEILELYLNKIYLGYRSYGVAAAAKVYFGKTLSELSLSEMALIAGLPKAPSTMNPIYSLKRATSRRNVVLKRMLDMQFISKQEYDAAKKEQLVAKYHEANIELSAPYVAEMVRKWMIDNYGEDAYTSGVKIYTSLNSTQQIAAEQAVINNLFNYDMRHGYRGVTASLWQKNSSSWSIEKIQKYLKTLASYNVLQPAVVTNAFAKSIKVIVKNQAQPTIIDWNGIKWARRYKTDKLQGHAIKSAKDILHNGDLIWVRKVAKDKWVLSQLPLANTGFVAIDPFNGAIKSLVGGFNFYHSKFNRVTMSVRQVGSNIKPFLYAAGLNSGMTLATMINDAPIIKWDPYQETAWRPKNSPPKYLGPTRFRVGLAQSKNVMSIRILRTVGLDKTVNFMTRFGFKPSELPRVESIALGATSLTPLQIARGYSVFANGGYLIKPFLVSKITTPKGEILFEHKPLTACTENCTEIENNFKQQNAIYKQENFAARNKIDAESPVYSNDPQAKYIERFNAIQGFAPKVMSNDNVFLVKELLSSNIWGGGNWSKGTGWNGTGWRARVLKRHDIGGKTGTTNDAKDAWYSGISPNLVATVWVGFDDGSHILGKTDFNSNLGRYQVNGNEAGAKTAEPAWIDFMKIALADTPEHEKIVPNNIIEVKIDPKNGLLTKDDNPDAIKEYFIKGTQPTKFSSKGLKNSDMYRNEQGNVESIF